MLRQAEGFFSQIALNCTKRKGRGQLFSADRIWKATSSWSFPLPLLSKGFLEASFFLLMVPFSPAFPLGSPLPRAQESYSLLFFCLSSICRLPVFFFFVRGPLHFSFLSPRIVGCFLCNRRFRRHVFFSLLSLSHFFFSRLRPFPFFFFFFLGRNTVTFIFCTRPGRLRLSRARRKILLCWFSLLLGSHWSPFSLSFLRAGPLPACFVPCGGRPPCFWGGGLDFPDT